MGLVIIGVILKKLKWKKLKNGFVTQIHILNFDKLNFCFRNSNYEWDNNYNQNYICPIEEKQDQVIEEAFIINEENVVTDILENLFENNISEIQNSKIEVTEATTINTFENIESPSTEPIDTSIDSTENIVNNIGLITSEDNVGDNENVEILENNIENDTVKNEINVNLSEIENGLEKDIENIFNDLYEGTANIFENSTIKENAVENIDSNVEKTNEDTKFDMDGLITEILSPIANSSSFENIVSQTEEVIDNGLVDNILSEDSEEVFESIDTDNDNTLNSFNTEEAPLIDVTETTNENTSLVKVDTLDDYLVSARSLSKFYILKKRIKFALYKLFVAIPKIISHALSEDED